MRTSNSDICSAHDDSNARMSMRMGVDAIPAVIGTTTVLLLAAVLLLVHLPTFPAPWFDEGLNLNAAAMLAQTGQYALPDSDGPRIMDPAIQTGPVLILPIALAFRIFGVGLLQARLVVVAFSFCALLAYLAAARRLIGLGAALLAILALLAGNGNPSTSFLPMARQTLGEVAALGLLLGGTACWWRALTVPTQARVLLCVTGLAFGLAMQTKSQVLVVFPVAWAALCLADRCFYRKATWAAFLLPAVVSLFTVGAWYLAQRLMVSAAQYEDHSAILREGFSIHIVSFSGANIRRALSSLWHVGFFVWGAPSLLYGLLCARKRTFESLLHASLLLFTVLWLAWFVMCSIGWARYAFLPLVLTPIWSAGLITTALSQLRMQTPFLRRLGVAAVCAITALVVTWNAGTTAQKIFGTQNNDFALFGAYLRTALPANTVVESWEWELDLIAPEQFHHPPTHITNQVTLGILGQRSTHVLYEPAAIQSAYLIDGPFSNWTEIYRAVITARGRKVGAVGPYTLYRLEQFTVK